MNYRMILRLLGMVLAYEGVLMTPALGVSLIYGGTDWLAFVYSIVILFLLGFPLSRIKPHSRPMQAREGFAAVAIIWIVMSVGGALPFLLSGAIPHFADAVFECASGFTTTGSTILREIESLPHGILFWRSFTHWLGGMGVLVLALALLPSLGAGTVHLLKAESPGPAPGKLLPKLGQTAKFLYILYAGMTAALVVALLLSGMPLFDAMIHAFGTAGTGGFSNKNLSVGAYGNPVIEWILAAGMLAFGINFTIYFYLLRRQARRALKSEELWWYLGLVLLFSALITIEVRPDYDTLGTTIRHAVFQVSSIVTTTGFSTTDFNGWPMLSRALLLFLMAMGACAGSTGGGLKVARVVLLGKTIRREMGRFIHPRMVQNVKIDGRAVSDELPQHVLIFFVSYMGIIVMGFLFLSLDNFDLTTTCTAVLTCISNVGPGLGVVGPMGGFADFSAGSKLMLALIMIVGRLEIFPVLLLASGRLWRKS